MKGETVRRRRFRQKRRLEIIEAGGRVLKKKGLSGFTVKDVSEEMGIGRGTLYESIKTKNDILFMMMEETLLEAIGRLEEKIKDIKDPLLKLHTALHSHVENIRQHSRLVLSLYQESTPFSKPQLQRMIGLVDEYHHIIRQIMEAGRSEGVFDFTDSALLVHAMTAALNTWLLKKNYLRAVPSFDEYERIIGRLILQGLLNLSPEKREGNIKRLNQIIKPEGSKEAR